MSGVISRPSARRIGPRGEYLPGNKRISGLDAVLGLDIRIALSNASVADTASIGTTIGTLSVQGGTGSYTFTLTSNPGGLFAISGSNLNVAAALTQGSDPITVYADNGAGSVLSQPFLITVTHAGSVFLAMDMSDFRNTYILGL